MKVRSKRFQKPSLGNTRGRFCRNLPGSRQQKKGRFQSLRVEFETSKIKIGEKIIDYFTKV